MEFPIPTAEAESFLCVVISRWETSTPAQRTVCTAACRRTTVQDVASDLGVEVSEVRRILKTIDGILGGFVCDELYFATELVWRDSHRERARTLELDPRR